MILYYYYSEPSSIKLQNEIIRNIILWNDMAREIGSKIFNTDGSQLKDGLAFSILDSGSILAKAQFCNLQGIVILYGF
jgi:hypothetical protein